MFRRLHAHMTFANVASGLALFVALATGGAYAAGNLIGSGDIAKDAIKSKHIGKGQVKSSDLADDAVTQGDRGDTGPQGAQGIEGIQGPAGSARAWGSVGSSGNIDPAFGVAGDADNPEAGVYCITLAPTIDLDSVVVLTGADIDRNATDAAGANKSLSEWSSDRTSSPCPTTQVTIRTFVYDGDGIDNTEPPTNPTGDIMVVENEAFTFMVP